MDDYEILKERSRVLEQDNRQISNQRDALLGEQSKLRETEKHIEFYQQEAETAKTKCSDLQMELDKFGNQFAEKERQVEEQRRLYEMEESKLREDLERKEAIL